MIAISKIPFLIRSLLLISIVIALWLLLFSRNDQVRVNYNYHNTMTKNSDYSMTNFTMTIMNEQGSPSRVITGEKMLHYPENDRTEVINSTTRFIKPGKDAWIVSSNKASTTGKGENIVLTGNVIVTQENSPDTRLETEKLNLDTLNNTVYTDLAVSIMSPVGLTNSIGLHASLKDETINLHSRVKGKYNAPTID